MLICRLQVAFGSDPGAAPVGRATRVCWPARNATWRLPPGIRMVNGAAPGTDGSWFRYTASAHGVPSTRVPRAISLPVGAGMGADTIRTPGGGGQLGEPW